MHECFDIVLRICGVGDLAHSCQAAPHGKSADVIPKIWVVQSRIRSRYVRCDQELERSQVSSTNKTAGESWT